MSTKHSEMRHAHPPRPPSGGFILPTVWIPALFACVVLAFCILFIRSVIHHQTSDHLRELEQESQAHLRAARSIVTRVTKNYFDTYLQTPEILEILAEANGAQGDAAKQDSLRKALMEKLAVPYEKMKADGFSHMQIILADGTSFLRMHKPDSYGDKIVELRPILRRCNTERKNIFAFEIGRFASGCRAALPITALDGTHLGVIECSMVTRHLATALTDIASDHDFKFLWLADATATAADPGHQTSFIPWAVDPRWVVDRSGNPTATGTLIHQIETSLAAEKKWPPADIRSAAETPASGMTAASLPFSFLPLRDADDNVVGHLLATPRNHHIQLQHASYHRIGWLLASGIFFSAALLHLYLRNARKTAVQRDHLHRMMDSVADGIFVTDTAGAITDINAAACTLIRLARHEILGSPATRFFPHYKSHLDHSKNRPRTPAPQDDEPWCKRGDGTGFPAVCATQPLLESGHTVGWVTCFQDISTRKQQEQELRKALSAAEVADKAKDAFLATMSHEIRTPLNTMIGMASVLSRMDLGESATGMLKTINASGEALLQIINNILDFSKLRDGKLEISPAPFVVEEVIAAVLDIIAPLCEGKNITLAYTADPAVPAEVVGEEMYVRRILINLLSNAVKFTRRGTVSLAVKPGVVAEAKFALVFEIKDSGVGMSPEAQTRIFEPFTQADPTVARAFGGTGLGLALSKRMAEQMGGSITTESVLDHGSTFTVRIPATPSSDSKKIFEPGRHDSFAGRVATIVTPYDFAQQTLSLMLSRWGFTTEVYASIAAFRAVEPQRKRPAAILVESSLLDGLAPADATLFRAPTLFMRHHMHSPPDVPGINRTGTIVRPPRPETLRSMLLEILGSATAPPPASQAAPDTSQARVLVAEDTPMNREMMRCVLAQLECPTTLVENGLEAFEAVQKSQFDIILLDQQMPVMGGLEAAAKIRAHFAGRPRPAIVGISANVMPADIRACIDSGMDDFLPKPITLEKIAQVIRKHAPHHRIEPPASPAPAPSTPTPPPAPTPGAAPPVIDMAVVETLAVEFGPKNLPMLLQNLWTSWHATLAQVESAAASAVQARDASALREALHKLKGASSSVGFARLHIYTKEREAEIKENRFSAWGDILDRLGSETADATKNFSALIESKCGAPPR